ncbi:putative amidohydrolase [Tieghemostelium lacteum]|uniref:Putative amidohydrolase n=1 Tax=Tieghemostelium lacteum TaxID=361077 RepID=A0A152A8K3_TIELA|nr:putative amidohydrolase [Tieghemostelium lacteum]|eukprot:KYR02552.1 putative amidohydrolase [Tieghemostelium lacteum]
MTEVDLIVIAKWIIPVIPENTVYENHCLVVKDKRIVDITRVTDVDQKYNAKLVYNLKELNPNGAEYIITPGFFNMHSHSAMALFRSYADDVSLHDWLNKFIWPAEGQYVSEEFVRVGTQLACMEMIKTGTTYCNEMYYYPEISAKVIEASGMRATVAAPIIKFPTVYASNENEYIDKGLKLIESFKDNEKIKISLGPHAVYTITDDCYKKVLEISNKYNLPIHTHLHETHKEVEDEIISSGERPIDRLNNLGLLSNKLIAVHMTQLTPNDLDLVEKNKVNVVHCPESNLKLGVAGICPVHKMQQKNINVSLGTDSAASNDDLDLLGEVRTAAYLDKLAYNLKNLDAQEQTSTPTAAYKILQMATLNGAKALGVDKDLGSLEPGKFADFIAVRVSNPPIYDPISYLVYVGTNKVTDVWVAGEQLVKNSKLTRQSEQEIRQQVQVFSEKIQATRPSTKMNIIS